MTLLWDVFMPAGEFQNDHLFMIILFLIVALLLELSADTNLPKH